ncbi:MAG: serine/threonine-protein kinase [Cyanobacteriota bacterium]
MLQTTQVLQERYQLQKQLGNNAGRQTWLAIDLKASPPELVTVKLLAFSPQMQWDEFKLFEREASVLKQLNHPRIPKYRDYFSLDKQTGAGLCWFGLVQDYIPGSSVQQLLDEGKRFTQAQVRSIAIQVLEILTYLHGLNPPVLHRDIKPSNLILGEDEQIYLVDFGAVQDAAAVEGVTFTVVGTTGYAPLEQFWGKAVEASDLYALGATLIHLLTGIAPANLPQSNLRIQFTDQVSINPTFLSWIEALTEPDIDLRLNTANQALEALETGRFISHTLETIQPHFRTKIKLQKSPSQLRIKMPGRGIWLFADIIVLLMKLILKLSLGASIIGLALFLLSLGFITLLGVIVTFSSLSSLGSMSMFIGGILVVSFLLLALFLVYKLFRIGNKEFFYLAYNIDKTRFLSLVSSSIEIDRSRFLIKRNYFNFYHSRQRYSYSNITISSHHDFKTLFLVSGGKSYYLGKTVTKAECKWLMQEIKEWLS